MRHLECPAYPHPAAPLAEAPELALPELFLAAPAQPLGAERRVVVALAPAEERRVREAKTRQVNLFPISRSSKRSASGIFLRPAAFLARLPRLNRHTRIDVISPTNPGA